MHYFKIQKLEFKQLVDDMTTFSSIILLNIRCNLNLTSLFIYIYIYIYIKEILMCYVGYKLVIY